MLLKNLQKTICTRSSKKRAGEGQQLRQQQQDLSSDRHTDHDDFSRSRAICEMQRSNRSKRQRSSSSASGSSGSTSIDDFTSVSCQMQKLQPPIPFLVVDLNKDTKVAFETPTSSSSSKGSVGSSISSISTDASVSISMLTEFDPVPEGVLDIDAMQLEVGNVLGRYARSIFHHRKAQECKYVIHHIDRVLFHSKQMPLTLQQDISEKTRAVLVDWMIDISSSEFTLQSATLFLAVQMLDHLLGTIPIRKNQFQLIGCVCLLLASKFEEVTALTLEDLVTVADHSFTGEMLINMERTCIEALHFDMSIPTRHYFLSRFALAASMTANEEMMANYLLEVTLLDFSFNRAPASLVAAAVVHFTRQITRSRKDVIWTPTLKFHAQVSEEELIPLVHSLRALHWGLEDSSFKAVLRKYHGSEKFSVSQHSAVRSHDLRFDCTKEKTSPISSLLEPPGISPPRPFGVAKRHTYNKVSSTAAAATLPNV
jgi:hypothetical protein